VFAPNHYTYYMPLTLEQLAEEAMRLPVTSRMLLADKIVESLDFSDSDEIEKAWAEEAAKRRDEVRSGKVKPIPGEQVLSEVRRIVGR
jgi:putative addiction module component (TIGR02574 family)